MPKLTDEQFDLIMNGIVALIAATPEIIAMIQGSSAAKKEEWIAQIKAAQASWPEWT